MLRLNSGEYTRRTEAVRAGNKRDGAENGALRSSLKHADDRAERRGRDEGQASLPMAIVIRRAQNRG